MRKRLAATPIDPSAQPSRRMASARARSSAAFPAPSSIGSRLSFDQDPRERSLRLRSEPARGALAAQEVVAGDARDDRDRERDSGRQHDRAVDLACDEQQDERDERKQKPTDHREQERAQRGEPGGVWLVPAAAEVAVLDDARARRRQQLPCEVRGEVRLASAPQTEAGQERPIHQRLGGDAREPERRAGRALPTRPAG